MDKRVAGWMKRGTLESMDEKWMDGYKDERMNRRFSG